MTYSDEQELLVLPDRFLDAKLDDKTDPALKTMVKEFFAVGFAEGRAPALFGPPGCGKTYTAAAIAREAVKKGIPTYWAGTVRELNLLLDHRDYRGAAYFPRKRRLLETDLVIFDDFGQLRDFIRIRELFFEIVDYRYSWKKPTIFTANFEGGIEEIRKEIAGCFNEALARRILESCRGGLLYIGA